MSVPNYHDEDLTAEDIAPLPRRTLRRGVGRLIWRVLLALTLVLATFAIVNPPTSWTIWTEAEGPRKWTPVEAISTDMLRAVIAAEDANFCLHWGFDMGEIRRVIASGERGGASTITQQTVKNVFLWQGRSWTRKALEALMTPPVEALWTKRRIAEVYLNIAEFGPGIFGIDAGARHWFKTSPADLTLDQASRLAAILPAPKTRNPHGDRIRARAHAIADGARTIARDGRDTCVMRARGG